MKYGDLEVKSMTMLNSKITEILSDFESVLEKHGISDLSVANLKFVSRVLEKEESFAVFESCEWKCWYDPATNSSHCGRVCSF